MWSGQLRLWIIALAIGLAAVPNAARCSASHDEAEVIRVGVDYPDLAAAISAIPKIRAESENDRTIIIELPSGITRLSSPVVINRIQGGAPEFPLVIRGARDGSSQILGSKPVKTRESNAEDFQGVAPPRGSRTFSIENIDIPKHGLRERGVFVGERAAGIEVFQGGSQLWNARWPNRGFVTARVVDPDGPNKGPAVRFPEDRQTRWINEPALWIGGRWSRGWDFEMRPAQSIDPQGRDIRASTRASKIPPSQTPHLFVANAFSELDSPGEYVVDIGKMQVSYLPLSDAEVEVAVAPSLLILRNVQNVQIENIGFNRTLGAAIKIEGSEHVRLNRCAVRQTGGNGIEVLGGRYVTIKNSVVNGTAEKGIVLHGGNRNNLTSAHHSIVGTIVANFGLESPDYSPGVRLSGVGAELRNSLVAGGAHAGVIIWGNDNNVIGNEITNVALASNDVGAIYMGRDWSQRGNKVYANFIHNFGHNQQGKHLIVGVYLDDQMSGTIVERNVVVGGEFGVLIGGGRQNAVRNNIFVNQSSSAIRFDNRGMRGQSMRLAWASYSVNEQLATRLKAVPVHSSVWRSRYPELASLSPSQLAKPEGNSLTDNAVLGARVVSTVPPEINAMLAQSGTIVGPAPKEPNNLQNIRRIFNSGSRQAEVIEQTMGLPDAAPLCSMLSFPGIMNSAVTNPNLETSSSFICG